MQCGVPAPVRRPRARTAPPCGRRMPCRAARWHRGSGQIHRPCGSRPGGSATSTGAPVQLCRAAAEGVDGPVLREPAVLTRDAAAAAEVGVFRRENLARQGRIRQCQPPGQIDAVRAELRQIPDVLRRAEQVDGHMHAVNAHIVERTGLHGGVEDIRVLAAQIGVVARGILRIGDVRLLDAPELRQQQAAGLCTAA